MCDEDKRSYITARRPRFSGLAILSRPSTIEREIHETCFGSVEIIEEQPR